VCCTRSIVHAAARTLNATHVNVYLNVHVAYSVHSVLLTVVEKAGEFKLAGRICRLCGDSALMKRSAELIAQRLPDIQIAEQLGFTGHAGRMAVSRHRRFHLEAPARALAAAASKGRAAVTAKRENEKAVIAAAEKGDPLDYLTVDSIVGDLRRVGDRLEQSADEAHKAGQRLAVASLSGQQIRTTEVRAKLGQIGSYAPPSAVPVQLPSFNLIITMPNGVTQRIETLVEGPSAPLIDHIPDETPAPDVPVERRALDEAQKLGRLFGSRD
jgi:hypothetical protein